MQNKQHDANEAISHDTALDGLRRCAITHAHSLFFV